MELPDFDLAPLSSFDPNVFRSDDRDVDAFILSLALAYNDYKGLQWLLFQLDKGKPADLTTVTSYNGQFFGMKIHATRLTLAFLHELVDAIKTASIDGVLERDQFVKNKAYMSRDDFDRWQELVDVAIGGKEAPARGFLVWLERVRHDAVYHYYQPKELLQGYLTHFDPEEPKPSNRYAYASLGTTMEETRFFFADAAVGMSYEDKELIEKSGELGKHVNDVLRSVVAAYLRLRTDQLKPHLPRKPKFS